MNEIEAKLVAAALSIRHKAHAPYSRFLVGAAIVDDQGRIHVGCNVENAAYPLGSCAEAGAIAAMVAAGGRKIRTIAVTGGRDELEICAPCGGCRQRIAEFADAETVILLSDGTHSPERHSMDALLPFGFTLDPAG